MHVAAGHYTHGAHHCQCMRSSSSRGNMVKSQSCTKRHHGQSSSRQWHWRRPSIHIREPLVHSATAYQSSRRYCAWSWQQALHGVSMQQALRNTGSAGFEEWRGLKSSQWAWQRFDVTCILVMAGSPYMSSISSTTGHHHGSTWNSGGVLYTKNGMLSRTPRPRAVA